MSNFDRNLNWALASHEPHSVALCHALAGNLKAPAGHAFPPLSKTQQEASVIWRGVTLVMLGLKSDGDRCDRGNSRITHRFSEHSALS